MKKFSLLLMAMPVLSVAQQTPPIEPKLTTVPLPKVVEITGSQSDLGAKPLTADEVADIALKLQPSLRIARAALLAIQGQVLVASAAMRPTIALNSTYTSYTQSVGSTATSTGIGATVSGYTASANVRQLLFDFGYTRSLVRQLKAQEKAAKTAVTRAQLDIILQAKQAFYTYNAADHLVAVQESNLASRQGQLQLAEARLKSGLGQPADVVTAQTAVGDASQVLAQARATALVARTDLALAMGIDARTPITVQDDPPLPVETRDLNLFVTTGLQNRPEVIQAQAVVEAAGAGKDAARRLNSPSLVLGAGVGGRGSSSIWDSEGTNLSLTLSFPMVDGGVSAGQRKQAEASIESANAAFRSATLSAVRDITASYINLKAAEQRVEIATSQVSNAQEAVRLAEGRFAAGVTTFLEVTTAQAAYVAAKTAEVNAKAAVQGAKASLQRAVGAR